MNDKLATQIALEAIEIASQRAASEDARDWSEYESYQNFVRQLNTAQAWPTNSRKVTLTITVPDGQYVHSNLPGEIMDAAAQLLPEDVILGSGYIDTPNPTTAILTW